MVGTPTVEQVGQGTLQNNTQWVADAFRFLMVDGSGNIDNSVTVTNMIPPVETGLATSAVTACTGRTQQLDNVTFGSKSAGGSIVRGDEIVLKQNTIYCRGFVSASATNYVTFKASWYEHTDKD